MLTSLLIDIAQKLHEWSTVNRVGFMRASYSPEVLSLHKEKVLVCQQTFASDYEILLKKGLTVVETLTDQFDAVLFVGTKFKAENLLRFQEGLSLLSKGGVFFIALSNELGASRFENYFKEMVTQEIFSISKSKARVFGIVNFNGETNKTAAVLEAMENNNAVGIFGTNKIDKGSLLLSRCIEGKLHGRGADLGAGDGFMTASLLMTNPLVTHVSLYEVEKLALNEAKNRLSNVKTPRCDFLWQDVTKGIPKESFDWIVTNPPFHHGKHADPSLGISFIHEGFNGLKVGGSLFVVHNIHLPYSRPIKKLGTSQRICEENGFVVWEIRK